MFDKSRERIEGALSWFQQRERDREDNHRRLIAREGLRPDKHTGDVKGLPLSAAMREWEEPKFVHLDGPGLARELADLGRDGELVDRADGVRHIEGDDLISRTYTPSMPTECLTDDAAFDKWAQEHIARGGRA